MLEIRVRRNSSNVQPVMWTIGELALASKRHNVGGSFGGLDTDENARLNPNRTIPTLCDGDKVLWESQAVVRYLSRKYGTGSLWPTDTHELTRADQWSEWFKTTAWPNFIPVWIGFRTPVAKRNQEAIAAGAAKISQTLHIADQHLAASPYVADENLAFGDIAMVPGHSRTSIWKSSSARCCRTWKPGTRAFVNRPRIRSTS